MDESGRDYKPGDVANGHILGSDGRWHPLGDTPAAAAPEAPVPSDGMAGPGPAGPAPTGAGMPTWQKVLLIGCAVIVVGIVAVVGLVALVSRGSSSPASDSRSPDASASAALEPVSFPTWWDNLSDKQQESVCTSYALSSSNAYATFSDQFTASAADFNSYMNDYCPTTTSTQAPPTATAPAAPAAPKEYAALDARTWALLAKNPDAYKGQTFLVFGEVTQFDAATGTGAFLADVAEANKCSYGFFDGDNTWLTAAPGVSLANVVEDDVFSAQVTVVGSYSYDTQAGGNTTVPHLQVNSIEVQGTCDS